MREERRKILELLAAGKITSAQADELLETLGSLPSDTPPPRESQPNEGRGPGSGFSFTFSPGDLNDPRSAREFARGIRQRVRHGWSGFQGFQGFQGIPVPPTPPFPPGPPVPGMPGFSVRDIINLHEAG